MMFFDYLFTFAQNMRFSSGAIEAALEGIQRGKNILVDVNMAASGISKFLLKKFGGEVICRVAEIETVDRAVAGHMTRSEAAIERAVQDNISIVAVGNAPTALLKVMELIDQGTFAPDLVIGVPVGFVNAVESKEILVSKPYPFITLCKTLLRCGAL